MTVGSRRLPCTAWRPARTAVGGRPTVPALGEIHDVVGRGLGLAPALSSCGTLAHSRGRRFPVYRGRGPLRAVTSRSAMALPTGAPLRRQLRGSTVGFGE